MAFKLASLFVEIAGNTKPFQAALAGVHKTLAGMTGLGLRAGGALGTNVAHGLTGSLKSGLSSVRGMVGGAIGGLGKLAIGGAIGGGVGIAVGLYESVKAASDLNETINKTKEVFGDATNSVVKDAEVMARKFGVPKTEFLDAASSIGLIATASGKTKSEAAELGSTLAKIAGDASSFYNVPLTDALAAIRSGLVGEAEPLRRFGVLLSDNAVKAQAAKLGIAKFGAELTEGQKVQARYSLILKGMATAQGDLARTADGAANRMREIGGRIVNAMADLGNTLQPVFNAVLGEVNKAVGQMGNLFADNKSTISSWASVVAGKVHVAAKAVRDFASRVIAWIKPLLPTFQNLGAHVFGTLSQLAKTTFGNLGAWLDSSRGTIQSWAATAVRWFDSAVASVVSLGGVFRALASALAPAVGLLHGKLLGGAETLSSVLDTLAGTIDSNREVIADWATRAIEFFQKVLGKVVELGQGLVQFLGSDAAATIFTAIGDALVWLGGVATEAVDVIVFALNHWDDIQSLVALSIESALAKLAGVFNSVMSQLQGSLGSFVGNWKTVIGGLGIALSALSPALGQTLVAFAKAGTEMKALPQIGARSLEEIQQDFDRTLGNIGTKQLMLDAEAKDRNVRAGASVARGEEPEVDESERREQRRQNRLDEMQRQLVHARFRKAQASAEEEDKARQRAFDRQHPRLARRRQREEAMQAQAAKAAEKGGEQTPKKEKKKGAEFNDLEGFAKKLQTGAFGKGDATTKAVNEGNKTLASIDSELKKRNSRSISSGYNSGFATEPE